MKKCLVIGGGLAGLSSAVFLSERGFNVTLLESSPKLGGRTYSLYNKETDDYYDNGQHILMGCYNETINFLGKIKSLNKLTFQESLKICFVDKHQQIHKLNVAKYFYPLNLLYGILNFSAVKFKSRLKIIDFMLDSLCCIDGALDNLTAENWLQIKNQPEDALKSLWEILIIGAMNTKPNRTSAKVFVEILKRIFFDGNKAATILLPATNLTDLYVDDAVSYITSKGGSVLTSQKVIKFVIKNERIINVVTDKQEFNNYDFIISSIPPYSLGKISLDTKHDNFSLDFIPELNYSPILNIHLWLKRNPFKERFYGLIDSKIHWLFNNKKHISLTVSSADELINMTNEEILTLTLSELELFFPIFKQDLVDSFKVIKEKRATFIPDISSVAQRKKIKQVIGNLILCGDWVNTGLPATIESAVLSGRLACDKVIELIKK